MISIKWSETAQKSALASTDIIVTKLLHYHMPLFFFLMQPFNFSEFLRGQFQLFQVGLSKNFFQTIFM